MKLTIKALFILFILTLSQVTARKSLSKFKSKDPSAEVKAAPGWKDKLFRFLYGIFDGLLGSGVIGASIKLLIAAYKSSQEGRDDAKFEFQGKEELCKNFSVTKVYEKSLNQELDLPKVDCSQIDDEAINNITKECKALDDAKEERDEAASRKRWQLFYTTIKTIGAAGGMLVMETNNPVDDLKKGVMAQSDENEKQEIVDTKTAALAFISSSPTIIECLSKSGKAFNPKTLCKAANSFYDDNLKDVSEKKGKSWFSRLIAASDVFGYLSKCSSIGVLLHAVSLTSTINTFVTTSKSQILTMAAKFIEQAAKTILSLAISAGKLIYTIYKAVTVKDSLLKYEYWGNVVGQIIKLVLNILVPESVLITGKKKMKNMKKKNK